MNTKEQFKAFQSLLIENVIIKSKHAVYEEYEINGDTIKEKGEGVKQLDDFTGILVSFAKMAGRPTQKNLLKWLKRWGLPGEDKKTRSASYLLNEAKQARKLLKLYNEAIEFLNDDYYTQIFKEDYKMKFTPATGPPGEREGYYLVSFFGEDFAVKMKKGLKPYIYPLQYITEIVNAKIENSVWIDFDSIHFAFNAPQIPETKASITPAFACKDLLAYIWLEFYLLLANQERQEICPFCKTPFTPVRSNQIYCDDNCRYASNKAKERREKKGK